MAVIFFSDITWDDLYQRPHHFAVRFAKEHRVLWVEPIVLSQRPFLSPISISSNLYRLSLPELPYNARNLFVRKLVFVLGHLNILRFTVQWIQKFLLQRAIEKLIPSGEEIVVFAQNFRFISIIDLTKYKRFHFDLIDNLFGFTEYPPHIIDDLKKTINRATSFSATSRQLVSEIHQHRKAEVYIISNGVETSHFTKLQSTEKPPDLPDSGINIGYIGSIYPWFDFDLIDYLCRSMPGLNFVLIGREHPGTLVHIKELEKHNNFFFLGRKSYSILPHYLQHFRCGIIPFRRTLLTESVDPVKLYEYCAAGLPTVSTNFSSHLEEFTSFIFIARSQEEFAQLVNRAVEKSKDKEFVNRLTRFAEENDWDKKYLAVNSLLYSSQSV